MVIFVLVFSVINAALWIILLVKFKKLFSTDSIIERTRNQMNQMVADIDNTTDRNMQLVRASEARLKDELAEADKKMELFREATDRLRDMIAEADRINKISNQNSSLYQDFNKIVNSKNKLALSSYEKEKNKKPGAAIDPESSFEVTNNQNLQGDLFSQSSEKSIIKNEVNVTEDGAAFREVPLIITKVYDDSQAEAVHTEKKIPLNEQVKILYEQGYKAEEISAQLSCSLTEVQFIIDML